MISGSVDFTLTGWWAGGSQDISPKKRKNILLAGLGPCFLLRPSLLFFLVYTVTFTKSLVMCAVWLTFILGVLVMPLPTSLGKSDFNFQLPIPNLKRHFR